MIFNSEDIIHYCENHSTVLTMDLKKLERETHLRTIKPSYMGGFGLGRFLSFVSQLIKPRYIVEVGSFTGYGSLCLSEGLQEHGLLISIESNRELAPFHERFLTNLPLDKKIELKYGDATEILPTIDSNIDLVFIDAAKTEYIDYYEIILPKVRQGGVILADNVLWKGKILTATDKKTKALQDFNNHVHADVRVSNALIPVEDGIMCIIKN